MLPSTHPSRDRLKGRDVRGGRLARGLLVALWLAWASPGLSAQQPEEQQQVRRWLEERGLLDLQNRLLLQDMSQDREDLRAQAAAALVQQRLEEVQQQAPGSAAAFEAWRRLESLLPPAPDALALDVRISIGKARLQVVREALEQRRSAASAEVRSRWTDRARDFAARMLDELAPQQEQPPRLQRDWLHFLRGWASYSLGLLAAAEASPQPASSENDAGRRFQTAQTEFLALLRLSPPPGQSLAEALTQVDPRWLGLNHSGRAEGLVGLMLSCYGAGEDGAGDACRGWLASAEQSPPAIRQLAAAGEVRHWVDTGDWTRAAAAAQRDAAEMAGAPPAVQMEWSELLVRASGAASAGGANAAEVDALLVLGGRGLCRLKAYRELQRLHDAAFPATAVELDASAAAAAWTARESQAAFLDAWLRGRRQRQLGEAAEPPATLHYQRAAAWFTLALTRDFPLPGAAARCRVELGWCWYQLQQWASAREQYAAAVDALIEDQQPEEAARALWMIFACGQRLGFDEPQTRWEARRALTRLVAWFPADSLAERARYHLQRLELDGEPSADWIDRLQAMSPDDPDYETSRGDLCRVWRVQFAEADDDSRREACRRRLAAAVEQHWQAAGDAPGESQFRSVVWLLETLAQADQPLTAESRRLASVWLPRVEAIVGDRQAESRDALYLAALKLAVAEGQAPLILRYADALGRSESRDLRLYSAECRTRAAESLWQAAAGDRRRDWAARRCDAYRRWSAELGAEPSQLRDSAQARAVAADWATAAEDAGFVAEAAELYQRLESLFPDEVRYLSGAARCLTASQDWDAALTRWRKLLRGLDDQQPAWFEAKHGQIVCLRALRDPQADEVWRQFQVLHPDYGPPPWRERFQRLQ